MSFRALNTGVSGVRQFQTSLDVIGNNLANINTVAYKAGRVDFSDALQQTLRQPIADAGNRTGASGVQVGNGVNVSAVKNSFAQGAVNQTGVTTDLAISGEGFFIVKNTATNELFATRAGDFRLDASGFLVTNQGFRVQGYNRSILISEDYPDAEAPGDLQLEKGTVPAGTGVNAATSGAAGISTINIDGSGKINVLLSDGSQYTRGQILLQKFNNPNALLKQGNNLYSGLSTAGPGFPTTTVTNTVGGKPNTDGLGRIDSGALEVSNVDIAREFASLITTQRAFQANSRVITVSDDMLSEIIRIVR